MRRSRERAAAAGFTLLEMVVALAVTGLAVSAAYAGLASLADARRTSRAASEPLAAAAARRRALTGWLRSAYFLFGSTHLQDGATSRDAVSFAVPDGGPLHPGPHRVDLYVDLNPTTSARGLVAVLTPLRGASPGPPDTVVLAPEATGAEIRYRVQERGERRWVVRWQGDDQGRATLPDAIRVRLTATARIHLGPGSGGAGPGRAEGEIAPLMAVPIVVPLEAAAW